MARGHVTPYGNPSNDPFLMLRNEMEQLFDNVLREPPQRGPGRGTVVAPRMDVSEDDKEIKVTAEMPGATPDNISVTIDDDVLTIQGEREQERETSRKNYHLVERAIGVFRRSLRLPTPVDAEKVTARLDNGVLTITVPKNATSQRSRRVQVTGGTSSPSGGSDAQGGAAAENGDAQQQRDKAH